ncbi:MAG: ribose-phosphate diphosphokinase [Burkholderiales bacterium]|nr:ribose-phosphate diphosphokinase [Burkholderiales bacterium]
MTRGALALFALGATRAFGEAVAARLGLALAPHEEREFEDGEHKARPLASVRDADAYVLHALHGTPGAGAGDKLVRLAFFAQCLKDAGAARVTAVAPYLCYARKDRRTQPRDPVTTRYVAQVLEACGADRVVTLDVHNLAAFQNAFRRETVHLEARPLFVAHFAGRVGREALVVVSPDAGGVKRAERFRASLAAALGRPLANAFVEKYREQGVVSGEAVVGDVRGKAAILLDDLVSTGGTLLRAARACRARGATAVHAAATHGIFSANAAEVIADAALDSMVVTNSVTPLALAPAAFGGKLVVLDVAPLVADAIRRLHEGGSVGELYGE